jgi:drug/metabolite transporter (DMT)-like permease
VSGWSEDESDQIDHATELQVASRRTDGTLRRFVTIWAVRGGIAVVFSEQLATATPPVASLVTLLGAGFLAGSNVILKRFPRCHPVANIAVAMVAGSVLLLVASIAAGEAPRAPADGETWIAITYVALGGSVGVFSLSIHLIGRVPASTASYVMLLMPIVTIGLASAVTGDESTPPLVLGSVLVLLGVSVGAWTGGRATVASSPPAGRPASASSTIVSQPGCA